MKVEITTKNTLINFYTDKQEVTRINVTWLRNEKSCFYYVDTEKIHKLLIRAMMLAQKVEKIPAMVSRKEDCLVINY